MITGTASVETVLKRHGLSAAFLNPPDKELDRMAEDIRDHGLVEPIVTIEEGGERLVLDGWGRYRCCLKAGVEPRFVDFNEMQTGLTPTEFVMARNMYRKHLSATQRACIAAEVYEGRFVPKGHRSDMHVSPKQVTVSDVAKAARVGRSTISNARTVKARAPDVFEKLKSGELTDLDKAFRTSPRMQKPSIFRPSVAASRALSPMLIGAEKLAQSLTLKPAEFAEQWAIWEGVDKAKRFKAMKLARQWLDEVIAAIEPSATP